MRDRPARARPTLADGTYEARLRLTVSLEDSDGAPLAARTFPGRATQVVRYPRPHPYSSRASIHAIERRHIPCDRYPEPANLMTLALEDALGDAGEGAQAWVADAAGRR